MKSCLRVPSRWDRPSEFKNRWHTWTCADCRRARRADRTLLRAAAALRRPAISPALEGKILERMALGEGTALCPLPTYRFAQAAHRAWIAGAIAAALLAFLGATRLYRQAPGRPAHRVRIAASGVPAVLHGISREREPFERKRENPTGIRHSDRMNRIGRMISGRPWLGLAATPSVRPGRPHNSLKMPVLRDLRASVPSVSLRSHPVRAFVLSRFRAKMPDAPHPAGDLAYVNRSPEASLRRWAPLSRDEWARIEGQVRRHARMRDDFITIPFPRIAAASDRQIAAAAESYKREAAVVDPRLAHEVSCAAKAMALADFCSQLRAETGIQLSAGPSVGDEKVTVFCEKLSLREVMRQLSRTFGYTWLRSKREGGDYRYELIQDLKSQLLEEELRNRDRNAALIALDRDMGRYQPYLTLSPDDALARSKTAGEGEKKLLEMMGGAGWGPIQMYFRLSPQEQAALRAGQELKFEAEPGTGGRHLPADIARGVLQSQRQIRIAREPDASGPKFRFADANHPDPDPLPPSAVPDAKAGVTLKLEQTELGRFGFSGSSEVHLAQSTTGNDNGPYAIGLSPSVSQPENATLNARLASDPALKGKVTVVPDGRSTRFAGTQAADGAPANLDEATASVPPTVSRVPATVSKLTSADVLEAMHRASGMPIVADFYTRLYPADTVRVKDRPLFDALNRLADSMRLRWSKDGGWLQFRSASFYNDRLKEVPNRLLTRWAAARREHGTLLLDDLVEIAGLSDAQLDAASMADGARELWGLEEWDLACNRGVRSHLRWISGLTLAQREAIQKPPGLRFTALNLAQQQQFIALAIGDSPDSVGSLAELATASVQVDYTHPGAFEWQAPEKHEAAPEPFVPVRASTREAALAAARRVDPQADLSQIQPTRLALMLLYQWGTPESHGSLRIHTTGRGDTSINRNRSTHGQ
jgi:hypothetical protein